MLVHEELFPNKRGSEAEENQCEGVLRELKRTKATTFVIALVKSLKRLDVLGLPALGALGYVKLHGLAFLKALETAGLNGGEMDENIFARLAADKAVAFGVIEPLYCSLFHVVNLFLCWCYAGGSRESCAGYWLVEARTGHNRFGLTYIVILRSGPRH